MTHSGESVIGGADRERMERALAVLAEPGGVVLLPTETVYGLVCDWEDAVARERIYALKGRDRDKPLAMFAADAAMAERFGVRLNRAAGMLLEAFAPGSHPLLSPSPPAFNLSQRQGLFQ